VAETENHSIRRVDLKSRMVSTVAGNGRQAHERNQEGKGVELNSPWDLVLIGDMLYVAMAGPHQLWTLDPKSGEAKIYAGSGHENITDGPLKACALAQPSGIATDGKKLYFADSEVSAVRTADLDRGRQVRTLIGQGLFEFGDVDGAYPKARLQHPLGVAYYDCLVYVADTYNHKIKKLDPQTRELTTFIGAGKRSSWHYIIHGEPIGAAADHLHWNFQRHILEITKARVTGVAVEQGKLENHGGVAGLR